MDWDKWVDEDEEEEEGDKGMGGFDLSQLQNFQNFAGGMGMGGGGMGMGGERGRARPLLARGHAEARPALLARRGCGMYRQCGLHTARGAGRPSPGGLAGSSGPLRARWLRPACHAD